MCLVYSHEVQPEGGGAGSIKLRVSDGSIGRDFYVPSTTPVNGNSDDGVFDMHAKQTRFFFTTKGNYDGHSLGGRIERDAWVKQAKAFLKG